MSDPNVFFILTALDEKNKASSAFRLSENEKWLRKAAAGVAEEPTISSREATPADDPLTAIADGAVNRLVVTFVELGKMLLLEGVQFGTRTLSYVLLGHRGTGGISAKQYYIAVDDRLCVWLHDFHSTHGTAVGHNGQNQTEVRKKETWLLAYEPGSREQFKKSPFITEA